MLHACYSYLIYEFLIRYHLKDVIVGKIYFLLVRINKDDPVSSVARVVHGDFELHLDLFETVEVVW